MYIRMTSVVVLAVHHCMRCNSQIQGWVDFLKQNQINVHTCIIRASLSDPTIVGRAWHVRTSSEETGRFLYLVVSEWLVHCAHKNVLKEPESPYLVVGEWYAHCAHENFLNTLYSFLLFTSCTCKRILLHGH